MNPLAKQFSNMGLLVSFMELLFFLMLLSLGFSIQLRTFAMYSRVTDLKLIRPRSSRFGMSSTVSVLWSGKQVSLPEVCGLCVLFLSRSGREQSDTADSTVVAIVTLSVVDTSNVEPGKGILTKSLISISLRNV